MRIPVAAGFYPSERKKLDCQVSSFLDQNVSRKPCLGTIVPHAGYVFSGPTTGKAYASISTKAKTFVIAGPNHTGFGSPVAMSTQDWKTPLGISKTDRRLSGKVPESEDSHMFEHSIEVQLPFIQKRFPGAKIIPLCLSDIGIDEIRELAGKIASGDFFYIASSDFTHFGPNYNYTPVNGSDEENLDYTRKLDMKAIDLILKLQPERFYGFVKENGMTICGAVPITLVLLACKELGAKRAELIGYSTSYEVHPDRSFVNYAGIVIE